jgi:hypothetical protein
MGVAASEQFEGQEFLPDDHAEVVAYEDMLAATRAGLSVSPVVSAMAMLTVSDGVLSGINPPAFGLAMAFALGTGCYWLFFTEPQPDLNYSYNVTSSHGQVNVTARDTSFMEITVTEAGSPIDPAEVSIQIFRVN